MLRGSLSYSEILSQKTVSYPHKKIILSLFEISDTFLSYSEIISFIKVTTRGSDIGTTMCSTIQSVDMQIAWPIVGLLIRWSMQT